jgi:outer membrane cobalamin receptor
VPVRDREDVVPRTRRGRATVGPLLCSLTLITTSALHAQEPATDGGTAPPPAELIVETVVVTAARHEQSIDQVPTHITVLGAREIDATPALTVDDTLRQIPGFSLFRRSSSVVAHPTTQGVSLRGIGPSGVSRTMVLLDGIPLNDPFGGWVTWGRVAKAELERAELVRGGGSSAWGSSALGGVIQLLTHRPDQRRFDARIEAGERGTTGADLALSGRPDRVGYGIFATHFDTDGYPVVRSDQRGVVDVPAHSEHQGLEGRLDLGLGESSELGLRVELYDEERGNGTPLTNNGTELMVWRSQFDHTASFGTFAARGFVQEQEFDSTFSSQAADRSSEVPALDQFLVDVSTVGVGAELVAGGGSHSAHTVAGGLEWRTTEGFTNEHFFLSGGDFTRLRRAGGDEELGGLWAQDSWTVNDRVALSMGARVDRWSTTSGLRRETDRASGSVLLEQLSPDREETEWSPRIGAAFEATPRLRVTGALYRSFRAPTLNELFRPFRVRNDITAANDTLQPETLSGGEVGLRFVDQRLSWGVHLFRSDLADAIGNVTLGTGPGVVGPCGFVPGGGVCRQRQNLGDVRVEGVEAELEVAVTSRWRLGASYLLDDTEVVDAPTVPEIEGNRLAQVPENQFSVRSDWTARRFGWTVVGRWLDEQFEDDRNDQRLEAFTVLDASARFALSPRWDFFAAVENLFDEEIEAGVTGEGLVTIGQPRLLRFGVRFHLEAGS